MLEEKALEENKKEFKKKADPEVIKKVLENKDIQEEIDKVSEEKARKMYLKKKLEESTDEKLMNELESYSKLEKDDFKSLISDREKLLSNYKDCTISELENFSKKLDSTRRIEKSFRMFEERERNRVIEDKPTISAPSNTPPNTLDEIEANPSAYKQFEIYQNSNFYLTNDPHKEFADHEKSNLCSVFNDDCRDASETWYKEYLQSKSKNKKHIKNLYTKIS